MVQNPRVYEAWTDLIGQVSTDGDVIAQLAQAGANPPRLKPSALSELVELEQLQLCFSAQVRFPAKTYDLHKMTSVLSEVSLFLDEDEDELCYRGPLPHDLVRSDKRKQVRTKLGDPSTELDDVDVWEGDPLYLRVDYNTDNSIEVITFQHPLLGQE